MLKFVLNRPIAVLMTFLAIVMLGVMSYFRLPVSLIPEAEVPKLRVDVTYPSGSPGFIEQSILRPLRAKLQGLFKLATIESVSSSGAGQLELTFAYGTDMQLAYLEANERVDQIFNALPRDLDRPVIKRLAVTDIPIMRIQMTANGASHQELSDIARFIIKRRLEQIPGISLVEMNGGYQKVFRIKPDREKLIQMGISESQIINALSSANSTLNQIKVREGIYEYDITFDNMLEDPDNLDEIRIFLKNGQSVPISAFTATEISTARPLGKHIYDGKEGIVFAIHKQSHASYTEVDSKLTDLLTEFRQDFPSFEFWSSQSQASLLKASIGQLFLSLVLGILLASSILFMFSGEWKSPLLLGVLIPVSLLMSLALMFLLNISINIISLSGMILGIGILIDNGIIIIDNIQSKRIAGKSVEESCLVGTSEMIPALVSATLTTLSVFVPLVLLEGLPGHLFREQAYTLGVILTSSLLASFLLLPVLYKLVQPPQRRASNVFFLGLLNTYKRYQKPVVIRFFISLFWVTMVSGLILVYYLPSKNLPDMETQDAQIRIFWDDAVTLVENERRLNEIVNSLNGITLWEADVGKNDILEEGLNIAQQCLLYVHFLDPETKERQLQLLKQQFFVTYPKAKLVISRAKNPYDQLFQSDEPYVALRLRTINGNYLNPETLLPIMDDTMILGEGFQKQSNALIVFDRSRLYAYGLTEEQIINKMNIHLSDHLITTVNGVSEAIPIVIRGNGKINKGEIDLITVQINDTTQYPISHFFQLQAKESPTFITADKAGVYQEILIPNFRVDLENLLWSVRAFVQKNRWLLSVSGQFIQSKANFRKLLWSFALAVVLLYVILAAQFESFRLPVIILSEIPISVSGSIVFLWLFGEGINVSSFIGIVIMLGIIVNDSILKVDTINRYRRQQMKLSEAIKAGGVDRLKPILMTTLTTILAMMPVLFSSGLGGDLQRPLAVSVIGGLLVGTFCSLYLVPVMYRRLMR